MQNQEHCDDYADQVIDGHPEFFDGIEIRGVRTWITGLEEPSVMCEPDDDNPEFYSVYLHRIEGGVDCVGDYATHTMARHHAAKLALRYRWPCWDYLS
jgi:hypothetical protein